MKVTKDKVVSLTYELRLDSPEGEVVESLSPESPLTFLYGSGNLLPKFEDNISGLKVGDNFKFNLSAADAYGEINENAIVNVPISAFEVDGKVDDSLVKIGNSIPMQDSSGNRLTGTVKEIHTDAVKMDFNHPLAGNSLFFEGEVTEIREPSDEELMHGHVHTGGSCNGGCSSCGGEDDGSCC